MVHFFSSTTRPKMNLAPVVIVGLGRFGSAMARELTDHGVEVMGIDSRQRMVQNAADIVTNTAVADSTDIEALRQLGVDQVGRAGRRDVRRRFFDDGLALGRPENAPENAAERDSGHGCDNYRYSRDQ